MALHLSKASIVAMQVALRVPRGLVRDRDVRAAVDRFEREQERKAARPPAPTAPNGNARVVASGNGEARAVLDLVLFRRSDTDPMAALMALTEAGFDSGRLLEWIYMIAMERLTGRMNMPRTSPTMRDIWRVLRSAVIPVPERGDFISRVLCACPPRERPAEAPPPAPAPVPPEPTPLAEFPPASPAVEPEFELPAPPPAPSSDPVPAAVTNGHITSEPTAVPVVRTRSRPFVPSHATAEISAQVAAVRLAFNRGEARRLSVERATRVLRDARLDIQVCCERARIFALERGAYPDRGEGLVLVEARDMIWSLGLNGGPAVTQAARFIVGE